MSETLLGGEATAGFTTLALLGAAILLSLATLDLDRVTGLAEAKPPRLEGPAEPSLSNDLCVRFIKCIPDLDCVTGL